MSQGIAEKMQAELQDKLMDAFSGVIAERKEMYRKEPTAVPVRGEIDSLIKKVAAQNALISGGSSLVPGPWGMLAVVPELVLVIRNQIGLIYDIGRAYGKTEEELETELVVGVFVYGMGASASSVLVMHGGRYLVKRASLRVMQQVIALLGGKITQQALKSAVSKWLPGVGAVAMAAWSNYLTRKLGEKAVEILQKPVAFEADTITAQPSLVDEVVPALPSMDAASLDFYKLQVLIGLAKVDGTVSAEEERFIFDAMDKADLPPENVVELGAMLGGKQRALDGVAALSSSPDDAIALLATMTTLAQQDDSFHATERIYIRKIGKLLGFSETDIEEVMASTSAVPA